MSPISNASKLAEFGSGIGTDGAVLQVDNTNKRIGIGTTNPQAMLQVGTGVSVYGNVGIVSATEVRADTLRGDGTNITGVVGVGTLNVRTETVTTSGVSTFAGVTKVTDTTDATSTTTGALIISGGVGIAKSLHVGQNITIGGTLTYEDVTNVDSIGVVTARSGVNVSGGQFLVGSGVTIGNAGVATFSGTADVHLLDNVQLNVGDGSDLVIKHDGSNSYITDSGSGGLFIQGSGGGAGITLEDPDGNNFLVCIDEGTGGTVELYKAGNKKLETTTTGATISGEATADGLIVGSGVTIGSAGVSTFTKNVNIEGNVAIGLKGATASSLTPVLQLHKKASSSTSYLHITNTDSGVTNNDGFVIGFNGSNDALIFNKESTPIRFATAGAEQMRIAADGKVGIDSTAPNYQLDVGNSVGSATTVFINATNQKQSTASRAELRLGYSHSGGKAVGYVRLDEAATNSFDGNITVGVPYNNSGGGSSTWEPIKIVGGSAGADIRISGSASGITSITWDASANSLIFRDNSYVKFGDGSDLYVSHTGSDSRIINTTGDLKIRSQSLKLETTDAQEYIRCTADADVKLFHDNVQKFSTLSTGSGTTGESVSDSFGQRLKTSNTGSTNDNYWRPN